MEHATSITASQQSPARSLDWSVILQFLGVTMIAVIGVPLFGLLVGYTWIDWTLFGVLYAVTGLGITVGYHRLISHRSFESHPWLKAALLIAGGWALQNTAIKWSADHVRHHARVDQDADPYNATKGFWHSHVLWLFMSDPYADDKYETQFRKDPLLLWQERYYVPIVLSGLAIPLVAGWLQGGWLGAAGCFLLAGVGRMFLVLNSTFCINSICHLWGDQPHSEANTSRNSWWISLITFGEGYHNYHHAYPRDYRNGPKWYNFDPSKWLIYAASTLGLANNLCRATAKS
ncbi:MAG: fatty acid desaturase [Nitrospirota bacterium]